MSLIDGLKPGDHIHITARDTDTGETDTFDATVILATPHAIIVRPDDDLMGLMPTVVIKLNEIVSLENITSLPASPSPVSPPAD